MTGKTPNMRLFLPAERQKTDLSDLETKLANLKVLLEINENDVYFSDRQKKMHRDAAVAAYSDFFLQFIEDWL